MSTPSSTRSACFLNTQIVPAVVNIAANYTYSTDDIISGFIQRSPNGAARSDTFPSAAALLSGFKSSLGSLGSTITNAYVFMLSNESSMPTHSITLSAGIGMTLKSAIVIGAQQVATLVIHITSSSTVELYAISGTYSSSGTSGLLASRAVVTDANKNLASLPYTAVDTTVNALMARDANGNAACSKLVLDAAAVVPTNDTTTEDIQCQNVVNSRKICLFSTADNVNQFYGLGVTAGKMELHVDATSSDITFLAGTSSSASNTLMTIKGGGGITLPTSGGAAANTLNYYEENAVHTTTFQGIWASAQTPTTCKITRIGKMVTWVVSQTLATANTASNITMATVLPSKWRPQVNIARQLSTVDNGVSGNGAISVGSDGSCSIYPSATLASSFAGSGSSGFNGFSISWVVT